MASAASPAQRVEVVCAGCSEPFEVPPHRAESARYCSMDCRRDRVELTCEACGEPFEVVPARADSARYCSADCAPNLGPAEQVELACEFCGEPFEVPPRRANEARFCSRDCSAKNLRVENGGDPEGVVVACETCGDEFRVSPSRAENTNPRFCSQGCRRDAPGGYVTAISSGEPSMPAFDPDEDAVEAFAELLDAEAGPEPDLVIACPECDRSDPRERKQATPRWRCRDCGHEFDEPERRPPRFGARFEADAERRVEPEPIAGQRFACRACESANIRHREVKTPRWRCRACGAEFEDAIQVPDPEQAPRPRLEPAFDVSAVADGPTAQPRCLNCGSEVSRRYVRVFAPDGMDAPRVCPACPDMVRDRLAPGGVREARASRAGAKQVDLTSALEAD